jgi:hypothetical protein
MKEISLIGLDKGEVLAALYNASKPLGLGALHFRPTAMSPAEARELLAEHSYFDYLHGRVMKVDLSGDTLRAHLYDRDNGDGAAHRAIAHLLN